MKYILTELLSVGTLIGAQQHQTAWREIKEKCRLLLGTTILNVLCGVAFKILGWTMATAALGPYLFLIGLILSIISILARVVVFKQTDNYNRSEYSDWVNFINELHGIFKYFSLIITAVGVTSIFIILTWPIIFAVFIISILVYWRYLKFIAGRTSVNSNPGSPANAGGGNLFWGGVEESELKKIMQDTLDKLLEIQLVKEKLVELLSLDPNQKITFDKLFEAFTSPDFDLEDCIKTCVMKCEETETQITPASFSKVPFTLKSFEKSFPDINPKQIIKRCLFTLLGRGYITKINLSLAMKKLDIEYSDLEVPLLKGPLSARTYGGYTKQMRKTKKRTKRRKTKKRKSRKRTNKKKRTTRR